MRVGLARRIARFVGVSMVFVMHVAMTVLDRFVLVLMDVPFGRVKPDTDCHQRARG